jgi:hypothetical protein
MVIVLPARVAASSIGLVGVILYVFQLPGSFTLFVPLSSNVVTLDICP